MEDISLSMSHEYDGISEILAVGCMRLQSPEVEQEEHKGQQKKTVDSLITTGTEETA